MAPHAESPDSTIWETSSYTPSSTSIEALKAQLRLTLPHLTTAKIQPSVGLDAYDGLTTAHEATSDWLMQLSLDELQEIEDAVKYFQATGLPLNRLQAEHFPLPALASKLRERSLLLHEQQPFFVIRGLNPQWFSKQKNVVIYLGIASHVATKRAMAKGDATVLHHVTNMEITIGEGDTYRGPGNRDIAIPFHNDYGEIVSLYTLSRPVSGGDFYLADTNKVVTRIQSTRPDLVETLRRPYTMASPGRHCAYEERPLLFNLPSNGMATQASRSRLCNGFRPRPSCLPELTLKQVQALDALHAAGQEVAQRFTSHSGDMMFFNNMKMMHARDGFIDGSEEDGTTRRYLLRLILRDERNEAWEVPPEMQATWSELYDHEDGDEIIPIHPTLFSFKAGH